MARIVQTGKPVKRAAEEVEKLDESSSKKMKIEGGVDVSEYFVRDVRYRKEFMKILDENCSNPAAGDVFIASNLEGNPLGGIDISKLTIVDIKMGTYVKLKLDFRIQPQLLNDERCWKNDGKLCVLEEHKIAEDGAIGGVFKTGVVYDLSTCDVQSSGAYFIVKEMETIIKTPEDEDDMYWYFCDFLSIYMEAKESPFFENVFNTHLRKPVQEGVIFVDNVFKEDFRQLLIKQIDELSKQGPVDFHPNSRDIVQDIIHPALFSFISAKSPFSDVEYVNQSGVCHLDRFGRNYESSVYQWLPTEFVISAEGNVSTGSYINGLNSPNSDLTQNICRLFEIALPSLEKVWSYVNTVIFPEQGFEAMFMDDDPEEISLNKIKLLRGRNIQAVPKIVDYILQPGQEYEGTWHVEGMSHEHIVSTVLFILDRDDGIEGGDIRFRRAWTTSEHSQFYSKCPQDRHAKADDMINSKHYLNSLGAISTLNNRLIVFPNSHIHKVAKLVNTTNEVQRRRIVVFFIVDPDHEIISTKHVSYQNAHVLKQLLFTSEAEDLDNIHNIICEYLGTLSLEEAKKHRLELMEERRYEKQHWSEREVQLCEH